MKRKQPMETEAAAGLRERKKQALRGELSLAAARLAKQHGLENVRTEDIVAAVGVSRRTFTNYFANKYEAIVDRHIQRVQLACTGLRARPRSEALWPALIEAILAPYDNWAGALENRPAEERKSTLFVFEEPALRAEWWKGNFVAQKTLAQAIAERTATHVDCDLYPSLVAATAIAAILVAMERWLRMKTPAPLVAMIREALQEVARGLPEPARRRR